MNERNLRTGMNPSRQAKPLMMIMRNAERDAQWRHTLQSGVETARVPLDELTPCRKTRAVTDSMLSKA